MAKKKKELTNKQRMFCEEYTKDFNATQAAIRAGYEKNAATTTAHKLLINEHIQDYLQHCIEKRVQRTQITSDMVIQEIAKVAFHDIRKLYDEEGNLLNISDLDEETAQVISSFRQNSKFDRNGELEGFVDEYKRHDKMKALELLGKHVGAFEKDNAQKQPVNQNINISWE